MIPSPVRSWSSSPSSAPTPPSLRWPYASSSPEASSPPSIVAPSGNRDHRVVGRVVALVGDEQRAEPVDLARDLRDHRAVDPGEVGGDQRRLAAVAAEELDDGDPLVRAGRCAEVVDELHAARDGGGEADAVVRPVDVVVHRLRDRHHGDALVVQAQRVREGVVAADRDQDVEAAVLDHSQRVVGEVEWALALGAVGQERRHVLRPDAGGVRARGVQDRPAVAVDRPNGASVERLEPVRGGLGPVEVVLQQAAQPRRSPITSWPSCTTRLTTALMHGFRPGTSPPPVRMPIRIGASLK